MGRVVSLAYRDLRPRLQQDASALIVAFRAPDREVYEHALGNQRWHVACPTLQFMALHDIKPSDIDGTKMSVESMSLTVPITFDGGEYLLAQNALEGGQEALEDAKWFGAPKARKPHSRPSDASGGGSDDNGGGKGPAAVEEAKVGRLSQAMLEPTILGTAAALISGVSYAYGKAASDKCGDHHWSEPEELTRINTSKTDVYNCEIDRPWYNNPNVVLYETKRETCADCGEVRLVEEEAATVSVRHLKNGTLD